MNPSMPCSKLRCLLILLVCAAPLPARAQSASPPSSTALAAESAFLEGVRLMKQGDCQQAVLRFEESERLDPASGTLLNLGYCQVELGKTASAWLTYRRAIALAESSGKTAHAELAREQGAKLESSLPQLRFVVVGEASHITHLTLDDQELPKESWSLALPVDPGPHRVRAVFDGGENTETLFGAQTGENSLVELKVPQQAKAAPVAPVVAPAKAPRVPQRPAAPAAAPVASAASGWALGLGAAGAGALIAGSALFVSARLGYDAAREHCSSGNVCQEPYYGREQAAQDRAKLSFVLGGSGALLLGAAAVLHFRASRGDEPAAQLNAMIVGPRDVHATYTRAF